MEGINTDQQTPSAESSQNGLDKPARMGYCGEVGRYCVARNEWQGSPIMVLDGIKITRGRSGAPIAKFLVVWQDYAGDGCVGWRDTLAKAEELAADIHSDTGKTVTIYEASFKEPAYGL